MDLIDCYLAAVRRHLLRKLLGDPRHADVLTRADRFINASVEWTFIVLGAVFILDMLYEVWLMTHTSKSAKVISSLA